MNTQFQKLYSERRLHFQDWATIISFIITIPNIIRLLKTVHLGVKKYLFLFSLRNKSNGQIWVSISQVEKVVLQRALDYSCPLVLNTVYVFQDVPRLLSLLWGSLGGGGLGGPCVAERAGLPDPGQRFMVPWLLSLSTGDPWWGGEELPCGTRMTWVNGTQHNLCT